MTYQHVCVFQHPDQDPVLNRHRQSVCQRGEEARGGEARSGSYLSDRSKDLGHTYQIKVRSGLHDVTTYHGLSIKTAVDRACLLITS